MRVLRLVRCFIVVLVSVSQIVDADRASAQAPDGNDLWRRWAIIGSPEIAQTGITDLVFAELAAFEHIDLVERDELTKVLAEQELQELGAVRGTSNRQKVGQLLSADAILFLGFEEARDGKFLTFWICDCRTGARLLHERVPATGEFSEMAVQLCTENVKTVRERFKGGVRGIVAVPPFVSQDLAQDFAHLQSAYAQALQTALMARGGLAVVEMEEGEAIGRELALNGGTADPGRIPLFINGRYETKSDGVFLEIEVFRANASLEKISEVASPDEVSEVLSGKFSESVLRMISDFPAEAAPANDLFDLIVKRAETMARFASYRESASLRETALLFRPDDVTQRLLIIRDLMEWRRSPAGGPPWWDDVSNAERAAIAAGQVDSIRTACRQLEFLMRNKMLTPGEAAQPWFWILNGSPWHRDEERAVAKEYFWVLSPLFQSLDHNLRNGVYHEALSQFTDRIGPSGNGPKSRLRSTHDDLWIRPSIRFLIRNDVLNDPPPLEVQQVVRFFEISIPTEVPSRVLTESFLAKIPKDAVDGWQDINRIEELFATLAASKHATHSFYGRCGQFGLKFVQRGQSGNERSLLAELDSLEAAVQKFSRDESVAASDFPSNTAEIIRDIRDRLAPIQLPPLLPKRHSLPTNPIPDLPSGSRVHFERLPIEGRWLGIRKCSENLDVLWNGYQIALIDSSGELRPMVELDPSAEVILDVQWDGEDFWLVTDRRITLFSPSVEARATLLPEAEEYAADETGTASAPRIPRWFDPAGLAKVRVTFHRNGLLQANVTPPIQIHPIAPGRCLAWGQSATLKRVWIAELQLQKAEQKIASKVFYSAIEQGNLAGAPVDPSRIIFEPTWHALVRDKSVSTLLIGRGDARNPRRSMSPLAIDAQSLTVSLPQIHDTGSPRSQRIEHDSCLVSLDATGVFAFMSHQGAATWKTTSFGTPSTQAKAKFPGFVKLNGEVYSPGAYWHRINFAAQTAELINEFAVDPQFHFSYFAETAHFGIVGWHHGDMLHKVTITDSPQQQELYAFVPKEQQAQHLNAVEKIEKCGGSVGARFTNISVNWMSAADSEWQTVVYLPESWTGDDDTLAVLKDLFHLGWITAVKAPISNAGAVHFGGLQTLKSLSLIETKINDDGTGFLQDCKGLKSLRLEGTTAGNEFSDRCLENVEHVRSLQQLTVYGQGFTETGLQSLSRESMLERLVGLYLIDTSVAKGDLSRVALNVKDGVFPSEDLEDLHLLTVSALAETKAAPESVLAGEIQEPSDFTAALSTQPWAIALISIVVLVGSIALLRWRRS